MNVLGCVFTFSLPGVLIGMLLVLILLYMAAILHLKGLKKEKGTETMKKYELLTNDTINLAGRTLYRIKALRDFGNVKKGDLGGYVEKEENLSHNGSAWVYGAAELAKLRIGAKGNDR